MKIILSRKGFDSSVGGYPSPVLPDGTMLSLPIPSSLDSLSYSDIVGPGGKTYQAYMDELSILGKVGGKGAHLDPDLLADARPRKVGWRPSFGQVLAAAGHLRNKCVGTGDLFLFYGWFRHTAIDGDGKLRFIGSSDGFHAIYGYLFIGEVMAVTEATKLPVWLYDHPHAVLERRKNANNVLYIAATRSPYNDAMPGAGTLLFDESLVLTKPGMSRSCWNLAPKLFKHLEISYHTKASWKDGYFQSRPKGQEFVIGADSDLVDWACNLIQSRAARHSEKF